MLRLYFGVTKLKQITAKHTKDPRIGLTPSLALVMGIVLTDLASPRNSKPG